MIVEVNELTMKKKMLISKSKIYGHIRSKLIFLIVGFTIFFLILSTRALEVSLYNIQINDIIDIERFRIRGILIGAFIGSFFGIFAYMWFENKIAEKKEDEKVKNYVCMIKADIDRTARLFKNKRFTLLKINRISVINDWLDIVGKVSRKLDGDEIQQLINYYIEIDRLINYEKRINKHLDAMQCSVLKDYPYIKEYNDLLTNFGVEVNTLFRLNIEEVKIKLNKLL